MNVGVRPNEVRALRLFVIAPPAAADEYRGFSDLRELCSFGQPMAEGLHRKAPERQDARLAALAVDANRPIGKIDAAEVQGNEFAEP